MSNKIRIKRGVFANLPTLSEGEPGFCTDTKQFYVGDGIDNFEVLMHRLFNANTILAANDDDTPLALTVAEQRFVGRITSGDIAALTGAQGMTILSGQAAAAFSMNSQKITSLAVPDTNGDAIRATTKITEVNLEDAVDKKHTQNSDTILDEGETNEVTAADLRDHLDSTSDPHDMQDNQVEVYDREETVRDMFDVVTRNGFLSGCTVNDLGGLNFSVDAGIAFVDGSLFTVNALGSTGFTDNSANYIYSLKANATIQISTTEPVTAVVGEFALREVCYTYGGDIHHCSEFPLMSGSLRYKIWQFLKDTMPAVVVSGCGVTIDTNATLPNDFKVGTGSYFINALDETTISSIIYSSGAAHNTAIVEAHYHSGGTWTTGSENGISFDYWDDGTGKHVDAVAKWYKGGLFVHNSTPVYVYPQTEHTQEADALDEAIVYPPYHQGIVVPLAQFIFRGGASAFGSTAYFIDIRPFFNVAAASSATLQNIYQTITGDSGSTSATATDDSLAITGTAPLVTTASADALNIVIPAATDSVDGYATSTQITKLDGIEASADVNNISDEDATDLTDGGETALHTHAGGGGLAIAEVLTWSTL